MKQVVRSAVSLRAGRPSEGTSAVCLRAGRPSEASSAVPLLAGGPIAARGDRGGCANSGRIPSSQRRRFVSTLLQTYRLGCGDTPAAGVLAPPSTSLRFGRSPCTQRGRRRAHG